MSIEKELNITYENNKAIWHKGKVTITLSDRVLGMLKYYYDTPLFKTYYKCLCNYPLEATRDSAESYFYVNKMGFVQIQNSIKDNFNKITINLPDMIESDVIDSIFVFPYLDSVPYHTCNLKYENDSIELLLNFLRDFWKKDIKDLSNISKGVYQNVDVQEKFILKLQSLFNIKTEAINSVLDRNTDVQFLCSMITAGFLIPVNIS